MKNITMFEEHLIELKRILPVEDDFSNIYKYFLDHMGEDAEFMKLGKFYKNPDLKKIIQMIGKSFIGEEAVVTRILLRLLQEQHFIHGMCQVNDEMMAFFMFKDINMGMASMRGSGAMVHFVRFTTFESPNKHLTLHNVSGSSLH